MMKGLLVLTAVLIAIATVISLARLAREKDQAYANQLQAEKTPPFKLPPPRFSMVPGSWSVVGNQTFVYVIRDRITEHCYMIITRDYAESIAITSHQTICQ